MPTGANFTESHRYVSPKCVTFVTCKIPDFTLGRPRGSPAVLGIRSGKECQELFALLANVEHLADSTQWERLLMSLRGRAQVSGEAKAGSITRLAFGEYFVFGIGASVVAPILPTVINEFGLSLAVAGLLFPARSLGGTLGGLAAGPFIDRYGTKPIVVLSIFLSVVGLAIALSAPSWLFVLTGFTLFGVGQRALSTCLNTLVAEANPAQSGRYLNYLQGIYGAGAMVAPLIIGVALLQPVSWRWIVAVPALLWAILGVISMRALFPEKDAVPDEGGLSAPQLPRSVLLTTLILVAFCYNGVAGSLVGWIKTFLDLEGTLHPYLTTSTISIFYAALTLGRFACGSLTQRIGDAQTILVCALGTTVTYPLVILFGQQPFLLIPGIFFCGLFLSGLYPTALAIANKTFRRRGGTITAVVSTGMTLGSMLPPWWTGVIADFANFQAAMGANMLLVLVMLGASIGLVRRTHTTPSVSAT